MTRRVFFLAHDDARKSVANYALKAPAAQMVVFSEPTKKRAQEEKYHAMVGDIAAQVPHIGRLWDADDMKRILVDEFAEEMRLAGTPLHHDSRIIPSLYGQRIVQLGIQTREFYVKEAAQFIEFLYAFGADRGVKWTEPKTVGVPA